MFELIAVRTVASDDLTHEHIELVGYQSGHMPGEPIMIPPSRVIQRMAFAEKFWVDVNGEKADVSAAPCQVCGFEPQLKTSLDEPGDQKLLQLPNE
ncbi:MAG: hypothetical protein ABR552_10495 [Actinomycetota bacterium]|nr:hypothetical protein [Actinomycetota bacterium]